MPSDRSPHHPETTAGATGTADERASLPYSVPFGEGEVRFAMPPGVRGSVVTSSAREALADPAGAAERAIGAPLGSPALGELARGARSVVIAITDATRACPDHLLVPPMLAALAGAGVPDTAITFVVAVGTHRPSTPAERVAKLGAEIARRYRVVDHDAGDDGGLVTVMEGPGGVPFRVNRLVMGADLVLSTGVVEPHQYAGFSGGGKTVAIGCADEATIAYTHGPAMLDQLGTRLARLDGNPFQAAVREVARRAGVRFVANAVLDDAGRPVAIAYGAPESVHDQLAAFAAGMVTVGIRDQVDIAVAGVGAPKDANLYQASRAATYLQYAPTPVVRPGGVLIIPARCQEGAGDGVGERRFLAAMRDPGGPAVIVARIRRDGILPGEQRAYIVARMLEDVRVAVVGAEDEAMVRSAGMSAFGEMGEALAWAAGEVGAGPGRAAECLVVPHALHTLPVVGKM